jgi:hypothetical protein
MEVLSPTSPAAKTPPARAAAPIAPFGANAPAIKLPLAFILTGVLALLTGVTALVLRPATLSAYHYNQYVIALTHLFVLGWICTIVMGAMYQLVPVALETKLYSEKLALCQFAFHVVGFSGMVCMFWTWNMKSVGHFGSVFAVGIVLFVYNIARTLLRVPNWNVVATAVTAALGWLTFTIIAGLSLAATKCAYALADSDGPATAPKRFLETISGFVGRFDPIGAMHAHAHLGVVGCFTLLIIGISYKLIPMFTLSEVQSRRRATLSVALLNLGLAGAFVTILLRSPWKLAFAAMLVAAVTIYGWELAAILRARKRRALDWGIRYFLTAVGFLLPLSLLALVLSWPALPLTPFTGQLENLYGFLGLVGVITFAMIGMLYKIVPFLVWFGRYSREIGRKKVPALADLYSPRLQAVGYWAYLAGVTVASAGIIAAREIPVRAGCALLLLSVLTFLLNVISMLTHFIKPRIEPLAISSVTTPKLA